MTTSLIAQCYVFGKLVKIFFSDIMLPRWNCKLYNNNNVGYKDSSIKIRRSNFFCFLLKKIKSET